MRGRWAVGSAGFISTDFRHIRFHQWNLPMKSNTTEPEYFHVKVVLYR